ncbi:hypothetical protein ONZ45_g14273 [Pleurotus djamor]|nr:hypothetical protein ONZ45_g14273 [Pleurotus djamor]
MVAVDSNALLTHIVSQTRQNVEFLMAQNAISAADGRDILGRLAVPAASPVAALTQQTQRVGLHNVNTNRSLFQARALWAYNEDRREANDLTFRQGDTIDVTEETNSDWWKGRVNGGPEGVFPSNYVERLASEKAPYQPPPPPQPAAPIGVPGYAPPPPRHGFAPPPQPGYAPPPPHPGYAPPPPNPGYHGYAPAPVPAPAPAPPPAEEPKKSGFLSGGLGNTLAHSAVGGVGFGAGSAVGSGIINSIF